MNRIFRFISVLSIVALVVFTHSFTAYAAPKRIGVDGFERLLEQHKGKIVLVNFFATWCPPCKKELPHLVSVARKRSKDIVVIGLSVDKKPQLLPPFLKTYGVKYAVYVADSELQRLFKVRSIPHNAMFDKDGELVANESGLVTERELNKFIDKVLARQ